MLSFVSRNVRRHSEDCARDSLVLYEAVDKLTSILWLKDARQPKAKNKSMSVHTGETGHLEKQN